MHIEYCSLFAIQNNLIWGFFTGRDLTAQLYVKIVESSSTEELHWYASESSWRKHFLRTINVRMWQRKRENKKGRWDEKLKVTKLPTDLLWINEAAVDVRKELTKPQGLLNKSLSSAPEERLGLAFDTLTAQFW